MMGELLSGGLSDGAVLGVFEEKLSLALNELIESERRKIPFFI